MTDDRPPIYTAPTTETLGDESSLQIRQFPLPTPQRPRRPLDASLETPQRRNLTAPSVASSATSSRIRNRNKDVRVKRKRRLPGRDFQQPQDWIGASCIAVSLPHRVAFERNTISLDEKTHNQHLSNKRSPSFGHLRWIQRLQSVTKIRQVQFHNVLPQHYQAILPHTHELPSPAPALSHKKTRLPHRADVGFPNATSEEINSKQNEIRCETVQEETSLRLIALVPELGRQVGDLKLPQPAVLQKSKMSILMPPLQSIPSASQGWRPRPIHDRPAYLEYLYVHCEASRGCLALYNTELQKVSEDFWYSSGQKGIFSIPTDCEDALILVWRQGEEAFGAVTISHRTWPDLKELEMPVHHGRFSTERLQSVFEPSGGPEAMASSAKKKGMMGRMFRTPQKPTKSEIRTPESSSVSCKVWVSSLGGDLLQPLLSNPQHDTEVKTTRLLADVSGDFAVILENEDSEQMIPTVKKRSNLMRLPKAPQPAGYASAAEFREVMYLPSQRYDYDRPWSYWSMLNLMYLYPRFLRVTNENNRLNLGGFSIRIRACRVEEKQNVTVPESFYSSSLSENLVDEAVSVVAADNLIPKGGASFQDEFKLRLPLSLDKRFALQVILINADGETLGEVQVPMCSSASSKSSKNRALTVIPNGNHRLKLGDFQLQLETRLVSAIHISDPCVATFLRDCPHPESGDGNFKRNGSLSSPGQIAVTKNESQDDSILSNASESAVLAHFAPLIYSHLWNLTHGNEDSWSSHLSSLFKLLDKVKQALDEKDVPNFIKSIWDEFDEAYVTGDTISGDASVDDFHHSQDDSPDDDNNDENGVSLRSNKKGPVFSRSDERIKKIVSSLGPTAIPFSRTAYGASKTDRMRLEAELQFDPQSHVLTPFFEDDETIATMPSILTDSRSFIDSTTGRSESFLLAGTNRSSMLKSSFPGSPKLQSNNNESEFATRVRTVAKVMLAPCVGPSLSSILSGKTSSSPSSVDAAKADQHLRNKAISSMKSAAFTVSPGSDDEKPREISSESVLGEKEALLGKSVFRGQLDGPLFRFSLTFEQNNQIPSGLCDYVYESIIIMWLRAWLDHVELSLRERSSNSADQAATFPIPPYDFAPNNSRVIFRFYFHMDLLLPLCLKSFIFRYNSHVSPLFPPATKVVLDHNHMLVLEPFVELLARGLVGQVLSGLGSIESREESLQRALKSSEKILDFLVGLVSFLHAEHSRALLSKFLHTLRNCETEHLGSDISDINFHWDEESLHRVRCCRELRIRTLETLLVLPAFVNLNYPLKFSGQAEYSKSSRASCFQQYQETDVNRSWSASNSIIYKDGFDRLPKSGWLADLLIGEGLSVSALSSEAIVAEAMAQLEVNRTESTESLSLRKRPGAALSRDDLLMFQSLGLQAINAVYDLGLRRHALDRRYQSDSARERTAALFTNTILDRCLSSVRWLTRMESTQKIRSLWLLSFIFVLQEAPDAMLRHYIRCCCDPQDMRIHRFIRLLRLCSATFQSFLEGRQDSSSNNFDAEVAPWLLQESFNTICAAINTIVEECVDLTSSYPKEQEKMMQGILDLLLTVLTTPQSSVTHLRAVGGALHTLETLGAGLFVEFVGQNLQHWIRIILSLMNSVSLSVRSIAVDFVVSLMGSVFDLEGSLDSISLIFVTVLPEVAAREIGLYTVSGHVSDMDHVSKALWPLRRAFAELEDTNPLDDDRVDPSLPYNIHPFCRTCQAVLDGVLIELRLQWKEVLGFKVSRSRPRELHFDADEESLFEAISFFLPESGPLQRIRWLTTLKRLHESKEQWVEAAEAMFLCARTVADSLPHFQSIWRPSRFNLWNDSRRSLWLEFVGEEIGCPDRGNAQVMDFANQFLEPSGLHGNISSTKMSKLPQPSLEMMCEKLVDYSKRAIDLYLKDDGMVGLAYARMEALQTSLVAALNESAFLIPSHSSTTRYRKIVEEAQLRKVLASLSGDMTKLAERLLLVTKDEVSYEAIDSQVSMPHHPCFVLLRFSGQNKPARFQESTTLPTFVDWDTDCVCRVSRSIVENPSKDPTEFSKQLCSAFAKPFVAALREFGHVTVHVNSFAEPTTIDDQIAVHVSMLEAIGTAENTRRFVQRKAEGASLIEITVAYSFPCALSRQRILLQSEIVPSMYTV